MSNLNLNKLLEMNYIEYDKNAMTVRGTNPVTGERHTFGITKHFSDSQSYWTFGNEPTYGFKRFCNAFIPTEMLYSDDNTDRRHDSMFPLFVLTHMDSAGFDTIPHLQDFLEAADKALTGRYGIPEWKAQDRQHRLAGHVQLEFE